MSKYVNILRANVNPDWVGWLAGIIEGEGCIGLWKCRSSFIGRIRVVMTDLDILERLQSIVGVGSVYPVECKSDKVVAKKQPYRWELCSKADIEYVLTLCLPFFGQRRKAAALRVLGWCNGDIL